jgi:hypothetical protein
VSYVSKSKSDHKFGKLLASESQAFAESVFRNGANQIGTQLLDAVSDINQPTDVILGKIASALKIGVLATSQEVLKERLNRE